MTKNELYLKKTELTALCQKHKKKIAMSAAGILTACALCFGAVAMAQPEIYAVSYNGEVLGYVQDEALVEEALTALEGSAKARTGMQKVTIDSENVTIAEADVDTKEIVLATAEDLSSMLMERKAYKCDAYGIVVNGEEILTTATEEDALAILEAVKKHYSSDNSQILSVEYKETVEIKPSAGIDSPIITDVETGATYILTGTEDPRTYTVQSGDTLWDIARANGMSSAELVAANPGFNPNKLKIGQVLNMVAMKPFMTVVITEEVTETQTIPFTTKYTSTDTMYKGQTSVITAGKNGSKEVVSKVVSENGKVISEQVLSETVLSEPVVQTAYKGTKALVYTAGGKNVTLANPIANVQVSDKYGTSRGSRRHVGIDLRAPKGTPIYAAADGLVTFAGYKSSFGKLIIIDHGNGLTTKYAHEDTICVEVGQVVTKGQKIGTVGRTGNATGNILHYEVLINGKNQNPINYVD